MTIGKLDSKAERAIDSSAAGGGTGMRETRGRVSPSGIPAPKHQLYTRRAVEAGSQDAGSCLQVAACMLDQQACISMSMWSVGPSNRILNRLRRAG